MKIVNSRQMADIDQRAQNEYGIPAVILMENAGIKAYEELKKIFPELKNRKILFVAGKGNNGGDVLVMARQFFNEYEIKPYILCTDTELKELPELHCSICRKLGIEINIFDSNKMEISELINSADLIIDGIYGTGLKGEARSAGIIEAINKSSAAKVSIDLPSGLGDSYKKNYPVIKADYTITIALPKLAMYMPDARENCGNIKIVNIGFPHELLEDENLDIELLQYNDLEKILPVIKSSFYKNKRGHAAVLAGSEGTSGAALLASRAAARSRCGLVSLYADEDVYNIAASSLSSVMVKKIQYNAELFEKHDSVLVGPGWGFSDEKKALLKDLINNKKIKGIIDADAFTMLAEILKSEKIDLGGRWILTPHPGEALRLIDAEKEDFLDNPVKYLKEAAADLNAVIVFKMHITYIISPEGRCFILDYMNPALGTGGSGDVLSGIAAAFCAADSSIMNAAKASVLVHSMAGKKAHEEKGWFLAEDLPEIISGIIK